LFVPVPLIDMTGTEKGKHLHHQPRSSTDSA
jgi:hypothetical protein